MFSTLQVAALEARHPRTDGTGTAQWSAGVKEILEETAPTVAVTGEGRYSLSGYLSGSIVCRGLVFVRDSCVC